MWLKPDKPDKFSFEAVRVLCIIKMGIVSIAKMYILRKNCNLSFELFSVSD